MATAEMSREEAAALYQENVRELNPDKTVEARPNEYLKRAQGRSSSR